MKSNDLLKPDGPNRYVLSEGGGCLSLFGLPFFAAGVFLLLGFLGFVPIRNENGTPVEVWVKLVFALMGIIFTCIGGGLVFGRLKIVIDREQGLLDKEWKVLFSLKKERKHLDAFKEVSIIYERGDSDTADRYPVVLRGPNDEISIVSPLQFNQARSTALALSTFLHLPLKDKTTEDAKVFMPEKNKDVPMADRPKAMKSQVNETSESLEILMPESQGRGCLVFMMLVVPTIFVVEFFPPLHKVLDFSIDIDNSGDVLGAVFFGLFLIFAVFVPLGFIVRVLLHRKKNGTFIKINQQTMEIRHFFSQNNVKIIPFGDVIGIERTKEKQANDILKDKNLMGGAKPFQPEFERRKKTAEKAFKVFSKWGLVAGGKMVIKTKTEIIEMGFGLSGDELDYLCFLIAKRILKRSDAVCE